jgi:hypothetical protein
MAFSACVVAYAHESGVPFGLAIVSHWRWRRPRLLQDGGGEARIRPWW